MRQWADNPNWVLTIATVAVAAILTCGAGEGRASPRFSLPKAQNRCPDSLAEVRMGLLPYPVHFNHAHISRDAGVLVQVFAIDRINHGLFFRHAKRFNRQGNIHYRRFVVI